MSFIKLTSAVTHDYPLPIYFRADKVDAIFGLRHGCLVGTSQNNHIVSQPPDVVMDAVRKAEVSNTNEIIDATEGTNGPRIQEQ